MSLFELERGRLVPAQFGRTVTDGLTEELLESVRAQVLEIIARPLFPVTWRDLSRGSGDDHAPRLTALDATGQVVCVEVTRHLTSSNLISALSALADTAALSWTDLARVYPGGIPSFRADWLTFRDSMPPSPGAGPRLIMVVGSIDPSARAALEVLVASGVEVHELSLRAMSNGRSFLAVNPVGPRVYAHVPQILGQNADVQPLEVAASSDTAKRSTEVSRETRGSRVAIEPGQPDVRAGEAVPAPGERSGRGAVLFPAHGVAPAYPRVTRPSSVDEAKAQVVGEDVLPSRSGGVLSDSFAQSAEVAESLAQKLSPVAPREQRGGRAVKVGEAEPLFPSRRSVVHREVLQDVAGGDAAEPLEERQGASTLGQEPSGLVRDASGLLAIAMVLGEETPLYCDQPSSEGTPFVLTADGLLRVWYREFDDVAEAMKYAGLLGVDGWTSLHFGDPRGPHLAEALVEINRQMLSGRPQERRH